MKKLNRGAFAALITALLAFAGLLRFAVRGYAWLGYTVLFAAALLVLYRICPRTLWRVILVLVCIGFAYFCFVESLVLRAGRTTAEENTDYVIVLGAAVYGTEPSLTLRNRCLGAVDYLQANPESMVIVSGGQGEGESIPEAEAMEKLLLEAGIAPERILKEDRSTSTMENLSYSFAIIRDRGDEPDGNVAICSSSYHLYRAEQMAKQLGVEATGIKAHRGYFFVMVNFYIREAFGVTHLWVLGD